MHMTVYGDLEIDLAARDDGAYAVNLSYSAPGGDASTRPLGDVAGRVEIDFEGLRATSNADRYGRILGQGLFVDPRVAEAFAQARAVALQGEDTALRVRLYID